MPGNGSPSPVRNCNNVHVNRNETDRGEDTSDSDFPSQESKFIFIPVKVNNLKVAALIDSGSSIIIISKQFYYSILDRCKL